MKSRLSLAPILLCAFFFAKPAMAYKKAVVRTESAAVKEAADPDSAVVANLPKGTKLNISDKAVHGYYRIRSTNVSGWMRAADLRFTPVESEEDEEEPKPRAKRVEEDSENQGHPLFNFRVNPLGLLAGGISANADIALGNHLAVGVNGGYLKVTESVSGNDITAQAYSMGAHFTLYLSDETFHDSWYISPEAAYVPISYSETIGGILYTAKVNVFEVGAMAGYQWFWNSGFNITLGGGLAYYSTASTITVSSSQGDTATAPISAVTGVVPAIDFSLGWAF